MSILKKAYPSISNFVKLTVKSHANCPINIGKYPHLDMEVSEKSLSFLLNNCDVALFSTTSAAIDAYLFNINVVTVLDLKYLNMSPLLGFTDVNYISSAEELISFLNKFLTLKKRNNLVKEYFFLDSSLSRWRKTVFSKFL